MTLKINSGTLSKNATTDAGFDIHSTETKIIPPMSSEIFSTNLTINLPNDSVGLVKPRSGMSFKFNIETGAGVIDSDYTGEIKVHLYNHGTEPYKVSSYDKIAQLLIIPIIHPVIDVSQEAEYNAPISDRGTLGFGSSGK